MDARGRLIVFEGGEGTGKSTQASLLAAQLLALLTREPGGTPTGERVRLLLLGSTVAIDARTELFLMAAARAQHVADVLRPALSAGRDVVCDRYSGSTLSYQGFGRGVPLEEVRRVCEVAEDGLHADLVVLLDVPAEVGLARLAASPDRIEQAGSDFHERVRRGFLLLAEADPEHWAVIDGLGGKDEVASRVWSVVVERLGTRAATAP